MKKIILLLFIVLGLVGSYLFQNNFSEILKSDNNVRTNQNVEAQIVTPTQVPNPKNPEYLIIPKLNVSVDVESVGKDSAGRMDVPKNHLNAAWYRLGATPGELGNSVIAAHYDTPEGNPSVFYEIDTLLVGDEIIVKDEDGVEYVFKVTDITTYENKNFPIDEVFGSHSKKRLNLITCAGFFDQTISDYTDRTVVFSEFSEVRSG